jgi:hypothetical protein
VSEHKVVHYFGTATFHKVEFDDITLTFASIPLVLDHPKLGRCFDVRSSVVCSNLDEDGSFYTMNTYYKKATNESYQND